MNPKKFFVQVVTLSLFLFVLPAALIFTVDPLYIYRKSFLIEEPIFVDSDRYQTAGLINSYLADTSNKYDTIIIGTSMSQNFRIDERTVPLTMAGGRSKELAAIAGKALATGNVKYVIWEVFLSYTNPNPNDTHNEAPLPFELYNNTIWDDWPYVFSITSFRQTVALLRGKTKHRRPMQTLNLWSQEEKDAFKKFQNPENIKTLRQSIKDFNLPFTHSAPAHLLSMPFPSVDQNLLPYLQSNPQVKFDLFFPPVSYYDYITKGNEGFWKEMLMRRRVLEGVKDLPNVRIFGFDMIKGIGNDITIYRDSEHYPAWVNDKIFQAIKKNEFLIKLEDWPFYSQSLATRINDFAEKFQ